jgi:hypothetical protein
MLYALHSQSEYFPVPFVMADIVDFVDDVSVYVAGEDVFCVTTEVPVAVSLSDELPFEYVILV